MINLTLTRDSVSMGDDVYDHTKMIQIDEAWKVGEILQQIEKLNYLPKIQGGKATWSVATNNPIAVIAQEWNSPQLICEEDYPDQNTKAYTPVEQLHFNYHAQSDPEIVLDVLRRFRTANNT